MPPDCPAWFLQLAVDCCKVRHLERPSAEEIIDRIIAHSIDTAPFIAPREFNFAAVDQNGAPDRGSLKCFAGAKLRGNGTQQLTTAPATVPPDCLG